MTRRHLRRHYKRSDLHGSRRFCNAFALHSVNSQGKRAGTCLAIAAGLLSATRVPAGGKTMQCCPWCGVPFDGAEPFCTNCGKERDDPAPPPAQSKTSSRRRLFSRRSRAAVGAAAGLVVVTITLVRSQPNSPAANE